MPLPSNPELTLAKTAVLNDENGDGCSSSCQLQTLSGRFTCTNAVASLGPPLVPNTTCVDFPDDGYNVYKYLNGTYRHPDFDGYCDDGNSVAGDGCTSNSVDADMECIYGNFARADYCRDKCGDNKRRDPVNGVYTIECDDGNLDNGDGCNDNCEVEEDWF